MKYLFLVMILLIHASCGYYNKGNLRSVVNKSVDMIELEEHLYSSNIYIIKNKDQILGNGFVISNKSNRLYTNSHVAVIIKYCGILKIDCDFVAENKFNKLLILQHMELDKKHDLAHIQFKKLIYQSPHVDIKRGSIDSPSKIYVLAMLDSSKLIRSEGFIHQQVNEGSLFYHNANTVKGMSGSPIFNEKSELIGIHKSGSIEKKVNTGINLSRLFH